MTCHAWVKANRQARRACVVVNLSHKGALLVFDGAPPAANTFDLIIDDPCFEAQCDVRHRRGNALGVFFTEAVAVAAPGKARVTGNELVRTLRAERSRPA